jgi:hypothetical protein
MEGDVMAVGKTLTIYLAADLKKFNTGMAQAQGGLKGFGNSLTNVLGPALIGAGIAAGALAVKLGVDGVKAAIEDEAAMARLATTMNNLGLAHDTQKVEDYIYQLERSLGIADTDLRPAYDRLVRAIGNTEDAQTALQLALDVSAGSGKGLQQVTEALGKAYEGNIAGLSRLGAGIDAATLRTGDMDKITTQLASTFEGQARTSASTYEGQIQRLSTAADNLKEAFGAGLLGSLGDTDATTQDLVESMESMEGVIGGLGTALGKFTTGALAAYEDSIKRAGQETEVTSDQMEGLGVAAGGAGFVLGEIFGSLTGPGSPLGVLFGSLGATTKAADTLADTVVSTIPAWRDYSNAITYTTDQFREFLAANKIRLDGIKNENKDYMDLAARQNQVNTFTSIAVEKTNTLTSSRGSASKVADTLNKAEQKLLETYDTLNYKLDRTATKLSNQTKLLAEARQAVQEYASGIQQNLLSGIDLETAFTDQFDEAGQATGKTLLEGFNKQIAQAEYFGEVLNSIKAQGADQSLIEQIASLGPVTGAALAQQLIDDGLVKTMSDKWVGVQETTKGLALSLVPEFLIAGQNSAEEMVKGTAQTLLERSQAFTNMGKSIGKKVGAKFKAEFLADIAAAVKEVEAIQTAARAERVASETARQVAITDQQVGQALAKIIQRSDNRLGVQGVPVLA